MFAPMVRCPRCDWQETNAAGSPARSACPQCGLPFGQKVGRAAINRTVLNFGSDAPAQPAPDFAATMPLAAEPPDVEAEQEATVLETRDEPGPSAAAPTPAPPLAPSTTKPPPPPFPEVGQLDSDDEEMTRMEQVPPEVLAQLMARAKNDGPPSPPRPSASPPHPASPPFPASSPPRPAAPSSPWAPPLATLHEDNPFEDEPTRMGQDVSDLVARLGAGSPNATQLGVPIMAPAVPAAPQPGAGDRRHHATQLGIPQQPGGSIPGPPRPLSSIPPPPVPGGSPAPELRSPEARRAMGGTLFGLQSPAQSAPASVPPPASAASTAPPPVPGPSIVPIQSAPPQPLQPGQPAPRRVPNASPTLLGGVLSAALAEGAAKPETAPGGSVASPFPRPQYAPGHAAAPPNAQGAPWTAAHAPPQHRGPEPQHAPQGPAMGAHPPNGPQQAYPPLTPAAPAKKSGVPLIVVMLLLAGVVGAGGFFALRWHQGRANPALTASIDAAGNDLELVCPSCPDGSTISLGGSQGAVFAGNRARLILPTPLEVGAQSLEGALQIPNQSPSSVKLTVDVEFRLDVDTATLHAYPPGLTIRPKIRAGGALTIAGKPATGEVVIPVGDAATGPRETVAKIPLDVAYRYERAGIPPREGNLHQELNVLPLRLFSPKDGGFTADATLVVQGQAPPGIDVHVAEQVVKPDDKGIFQLSRPLVVGENSIPLWLSRPEAGPSGVSRGLTLRVFRAASAATLWNEAKAKLDATGAGALASLYANTPASLGARFAFAGAIVDAQTQRGETIALIDGSAAAANLKPGDPLACSAASCLLRVVAAGTTRFAKGERVRGIGRSVAPRDPKTPEVEAMVLLSAQEIR